LGVVVEEPGFEPDRALGADDLQSGGELALSAVARTETGSMSRRNRVVFSG
jgi:hypothetical protein